MRRALTVTDVIALSAQAGDIRRAVDRFARIMQQFRTGNLLVEGERLRINTNQSKYLDDQIKTIESTTHAIRKRLSSRIVPSNK